VLALNSVYFFFVIGALATEKDFMMQKETTSNLKIKKLRETAFRWFTVPLACTIQMLF
jgi:hypothetical protein